MNKPIGHERFLLKRVDKRKIPSLKGNITEDDVVDAWLRQYGHKLAGIISWARTHKDWYNHYVWTEAQQGEFSKALIKKSKGYAKIVLRHSLAFVLMDKGPSFGIILDWKCSEPKRQQKRNNSKEVKK